MQAEDGNWYNEYDDLGYQFAEEDILTIQEGDRAELRTAPTTTSKKGEGKEEKSNQAVPNKDTTVQPRKKIPRPIDFDDFWYQDEGGNWRNEYDDQVSLT